MKTIVTTTLFLIISGICFSQSGSIRGKIARSDKNINPVISLLSGKDSSFIKAAIIDSANRFEFDRVKFGVYIISVTNVGYESYLSGLLELKEEGQVIDLPEVSLKINITALQQVTVVGKKAFVEKRIDRIVVNPDALISNAGVTALEVLEKSPGVLVDVNGNISLKGKLGVVVFIDDKPSYLAAADLANFLRTIPSGNVESIELMTNPPARYDAAGNAGVINIRLKKSTARGINGGINVGYGQGKYLRTNNSFTLNYKINKFNFFSNLSINQNNSYQDLTINRYYFNNNGILNSTFSQNSYIKRQQGSKTTRIGVDYYASPNSVLGVVISGFINPSIGDVDNNANVLDGNNKLVSIVKANSKADRLWKNGNINLNYNQKIGKTGRELTVNADYVKYSSTLEQSLLNSVLSPDNTLESESTLVSSLPAKIEVKAAKLDYLHPLKKGGKLETGAKISQVNTNNIADFFDWVNGTTNPNYEFTNSFSYRENINAAYFNYSRDWKKISIQAGIRLENTNIKGYQYGNPSRTDSSFGRHYTNLFPTFYMVYRADTLSKNQFGLSVGRRINRPNYQDLNPFTYPLDRFTYYAGNPFLQPTFSYSFELSHTYKNFLTTNLEYTLVKDVINETNEQRGTIYYSRPGNFGTQKIYGIDVNGNFQLTKWWQLQLYTELKNFSFNALIYGQQLDESRFFWFFGPTNQFTITKNLSAELAGSYQSRALVAQFLTIAVWQMRAGLSQKILKGKGVIKLNLSDLFYTNQPGGDIRNIANSRANWLSYLDSRVLTVNFSYRFSKGKAIATRQSGSTDAEKGRIRTN